MKLFALAKSPQKRLERQDHQSLSKAEFIGLVVDDESTTRPPPAVYARDQLLELAQNRWIITHQSVLIAGRSARARALSSSDRDKQDLLEGLEERYGTGATVVTAQLLCSEATRENVSHSMI